MNPIKTICKAGSVVFRRKSYALAFFAISISFFLLFLLLPVFTIPGNSLAFQLGIFSWQNYVLMAFLSLAIGLMISMQVYAFKLKKSANAGKGLVGVFSGFTAGIFGTAACSSCVAAVFGFLGLGTVFFLVKYQWYVVIISLILMLISVYLTARSIEKGCKIK